MDPSDANIHFDGVRVIGVDEHGWRHTRRGDKYVTVIIDLTPARDKTGPARLLDMVEGRSKAAFKAWLEARPEAWKNCIEVVATDGFTGFKTAPEITAWMGLLGYAGQPARRWEPKRVRHRLFQVPATLARHARQLVLHFSDRSRWAGIVLAGHARLAQLPAPAG